MASVAGSWEIVTWLWEASGSTAIRGLHPRWNNHLWASHSRAGGSQSSDNERCGVCHRESKRARPEVWGRTHEMTPAFFSSWNQIHGLRTDSLCVLWSIDSDELHFPPVLFFSQFFSLYILLHFVFCRFCQFFVSTKEILAWFWHC